MDDLPMISVQAVAGAGAYKRLRLNLENKSGSAIQLGLEAASTSARQPGQDLNYQPAAKRHAGSVRKSDAGNYTLSAHAMTYLPGTS